MSDRQALAEGTGPYEPYFRLVRALEGNTLFDIREAADNMLMGAGDINTAVLKALSVASELD